jgi:hypothetical protein
MSRWLLAKLANHFELILTVVGVLVALALTIAGLDLVRERQAFIFLVWLQGFLLWATHRHALLSRRQLLARLRAMLQDRVNNQRTVMLAMTELGRQAVSIGDQTPVERAVTAARSVSDELAHLSVESLRNWEAHYGQTTELAKPAFTK